jgi:uncharacterized protein YrrD
MPAITDVEGLPVADPEGREIGAVLHVLFHPSEPRVVALEVVPRARRIVLDRRPRYLPMSPGLLAECGESSLVRWTDAKLPPRTRIEKQLGFSLDSTVIWHHMEVRLDNGVRVGFVADVVFSRKSGKVLRLLLSEGSVADFAVGRREVPGELVKGFDGTAVIVDESFRTAAESSGGLAAASGKSAAYAKHGADKAADAALAAGVAGLGIVEKSFRSGLGRKALRGIRKAGKRVRKTIDGEE